MTEAETEPYDADAPFLRLVQRVEGLVSKEHGGWAQHTKGAGKEPGDR